MCERDATTYHRSMCKLRKTAGTAALVSILNPHCVSLMPRTHSTYTRKWNMYMRRLRKNDLWRELEIKPAIMGTKMKELTLATASSCRCARDPTTIAATFWVHVYRQTYIQTDRQTRRQTNSKMINQKIQTDAHTHKLSTVPLGTCTHTEAQSGFTNTSLWTDKNITIQVL